MSPLSSLVSMLVALRTEHPASAPLVGAVLLFVLIAILLVGCRFSRRSRNGSRDQRR
ncbi:MAG: hypothetical protein ACTHU0_39595 [Kofleriaceae bacterium]